MWVDLARDEYLIEPALVGLIDQCLRTAFPIHLGGIDQRQAQVDAAANAVDFVLAAGRVVIDAQRTLAEGRNGFATRKRHVFHGAEYRAPCFAQNKRGDFQPETAAHGRPLP